MGTPVFANPQLWAWAAIAVAAGWLLWLLSPILAPFLFAAILGYILDPMVEKLTVRRLPRTLAVVLVLVLALALVVALMLVVLPLFYKEMRLLADKLPGFLAWVNEHMAPWLKAHLGIEFQLDTASVREVASELLAGNQDVAARLLGSLKIGGLALIAFFANLLLIPVVLFYLLRDWNTFLARVDNMIPRHLHAKVRQLLREIDAVLAEFLRGQIVVILVMCVYYVTALWLARLQFALPIGIITGVLVFIPYVGALTGFVLGTIAALMQFDSAAGLLWVWLAFARRTGAGGHHGDAAAGGRTHRPASGRRDLRLAGLRPGVRFLRRAARAAGKRGAAGRVATSAPRVSGERSIRRGTALGHAATAARHLSGPRADVR